MLHVINWCFTGANGVLFLIGVLAMSFYNLDKKTHADLVRQLESGT